MIPKYPGEIVIELTEAERNRAYGIFPEVVIPEGDFPVAQARRTDAIPLPDGKIGISANSVMAPPRGGQHNTGKIDFSVADARLRAQERGENLFFRLFQKTRDRVLEILGLRRKVLLPNLHVQRNNRIFQANQNLFEVIRRAGPEKLPSAA